MNDEEWEEFKAVVEDARKKNVADMENSMDLNGIASAILAVTQSASLALAARIDEITEEIRGIREMMK